MTMHSTIKCAVFTIILLQVKLSLADSISGAVHNQTRGRPASADEVVLLRLGEGMQEEARTKTDAQGAFTLPVPVATAQYVVRVLHQGVNYDQVATAKASLEINVYDAVSRIPGLAGNIGMAQIESDGKLLKVTEMYAIRNATNPPVTQSNPRNFTLFLPEKASLDSSEARSGAGIWTKVPVTGGPGKQYAVNFPLRPGDTLFKFIYHLPYGGPTSFHLKLAYPIQKFAVIHPPSMSFRPLQPKTFVAPGLANGLQVEKAVSEPLSGDVPAFVISGTGMAPPPAATAESPARSAPAQPAVPEKQPAANTATPGLAAQPSNNQLWLILGCIALAFALGLFALWYTRKNKAAATPPSSGNEPLLEALKEELFQLESERMHGSISAEEYATTKQALNLGIQRALARNRN